MAHTLTEVASFDPTVTVPDGTDSRANAAEVVQGIAQVLANRSRALKTVTDNAAVKNAANTFTQPNTFTALMTAQTIDADVVNATTGVDARAVSAREGAVVGIDAPGTAQLVVLGDILVRPGNNYRYDTPLPTRHKQIALSCGTGNFALTNVNMRWFGSADWLVNAADSADGFFHLPLEVPTGTQLVSVDVQYNGGASGGAFSFQVQHKPISDWAASPATPGAGTVIGAAVSSSSGVHTATLPLGNYPVDNAAESYTLRITFNDGFTGGTVYGVRLTFLDAQLANY